MTCRQCGAAVTPEMEFCPACGAGLKDGAASAVAMPSSAAAPASAAPGPAEQSLRHGMIAVTASVLFIFGSYTSFDILMRAKGSPGFAFLFLALALLPVPIYFTVISSLDRHVRKPLWLRAGVFLWGALVATFFAGFLNDFNLSVLTMLFGRDFAAAWGAALSAPPVEETLKGLALLLIFLFLRVEIDDVADGIVLGALVGLGFAMTENIGYFAKVYFHGGPQALAANFYVRAILGGFGHSLYTGATGAGFGWAAETKNPRIRVAAPILGWCTAMFLHFLWDSPWPEDWAVASVLRILHLPLTRQFATPVDLFIVLPLANLVLVFPGIVTLVVLAIFAWRRETRVIAEQLRAEVAPGVVTAEEYAALSSDRRRASRLWGALFAHGPAGWALLRRLYNEETALAFRKWHRSRGERAPAYQESLSEDAFRARIGVLRAQVARAGIAAA